MQFKAVASPDGQYSIVPADLTILIPKARRIVAEDRHYLAYIPWQTKYLAHIPAEHQEFFLYVLPFLHARTSNVHTALSISQLAHLLPAFEGSVDTHLVYLALILHDCGWSKVTQEGLLHSLSYSGVTPSNPDSMKPKQQHLIFGEALAYELLDSFDFGEQPLSSHDIYTISEIIRRHDHDAAWEQDKYGHISDEVRIVCDADRLWSYTYENFWLDTVRKGVNPETYIETINQEITGYFFTDLGRARARQLLSERRTEVAAYARLLSSTAKVEELARSARYASNRMGYRAHQLFLSAQSRRLQRAFIRQKTY
jgi:hypothetical protein